MDEPNDRPDEMREPEAPQAEDARPIELDGILDLHMFQPRDIKRLVPDWIAACREAGILEVRIIHGKGIGVQREIVQKILVGHPGVICFAHPNDSGSWGATVAQLKPLRKD